MPIWIIIGLVAYLIKSAGSPAVVEEPADFIDFPDNSNNNVIITDDVDVHCSIRYAENAGTQNFSLNEFHSNDGTLVPNSIRGNVQLVMDQLQIVREYVALEFGQSLPIIITSGYRSPSHNSNVGGEPDSYHLCGMAVDFYIAGLSNAEVQEIMNFLMTTGQIINGGLGSYVNFTHYDIGPQRRWSRL